MASRKRNTQRGFGDPSASEPPPAPDAEDEDADADPLEPAGAFAIGEADIELEHIREKGGPALLSGPWRAVEIWTQNRIYGLDGAMECREVVDRASGKAADDHPTLGQRLVGGQLRDDQGRILQVSHPLPTPGAMAVFASGFGKRIRVSETSPVTRVVIRQRVVDVDGATPRWEDITGNG